MYIQYCENKSVYLSRGCKGTINHVTCIYVINWCTFQVHMGTHMWTNGASRRGRRMSLDLPPLPITPKDSDFLHRRPDLFYPYLPAPFLNGMQQKVTKNILLILLASYRVYYSISFKTVINKNIFKYVTQNIHTLLFSIFKHVS